MHLNAKCKLILLIFTGYAVLFPLTLFSESSDRTNKFSLGLSIVDSNFGINSRYYFLPKQSIQGTLGAVKGGTFFNVAYLYDFFEAGQKPDIKFYAGGGAITTVVNVKAPFFGTIHASATGLWVPVGLSMNFEPAEIFAEIDLVAYVGSYSGSEVTYSIGGRYYFN